MAIGMVGGVDVGASCVSVDASGVVNGAHSSGMSTKELPSCSQPS